MLLSKKGGKLLTLSEGLTEYCRQFLGTLTIVLSQEPLKGVLFEFNVGSDFLKILGYVQQEVRELPPF